MVEPAAPGRAKRQPRGTSLRLLAAIVAIGLLASWTVLPQLFPPGRGLIGKPAPSFSLPLIANGEPGARMALRDLRGTVVVLDFWATWCEPCLVQAPILDRVARKNPKSVVVLGVSVDDEPARAAAFARAKGLSYPLVIDEDGAVQAAYGARSLPLVVVIDAAGKVEKVLPGVSSRARLDEAIRSASAAVPD